jgi:hypothetical protein
MPGTKLLYTALLAVLVPAILNAATLNGFIKDASDGESLPNTTIALPALKMGTLSNASGYYAITGLPPGRHVVVISHIGYRTQLDTLDLIADQALRWNINLSVESIRLQEETVIIADRLGEEFRQQTGFSVLQAQDMQQMPAVGESDLLRSLQLLPGIQAASDISSGLYVRGGGPDQTRILLDQVPLYNPSHAFGFFSTFNPDAIKDVSLYKGVYPAAYGGNLGALLDVQNREGNRQTLSGRGGLSLISGRLLLEGPIGTGAWMLSGRRTYLDPVLSAVRASGANVPSYYFYDFNGKFSQRLGPSDELVISTYFGQDVLDFDLDAETFFALNWGNRTLTGRWSHLFSPTLFGRFIAAFSTYESDTSLSFFDTPVLFDNSVRDLSFKADFDYYVQADHTIAAGLLLTDYKFTFRQTFNQRQQLDLNQEPWLMAAYVQDDWQATPLMHLRLGSRFSYFTAGQRLSLEPRFSLSYELQPGLRLKTGGGIYHQYLQLVTTEGFSGGDYWLPLDASVKPSRSYQTALGLDWEVSSRYRLSAETYYTDMDQLALLDNNTVADSEETRSTDLFVTDGTGYAAGLELFAERRLGRLRGWLGYTLGWTRRQFPELNRGRTFPPKYDRRHDISLNSSYRQSKWTWNLSLVYATGQAFTPAGARYTLRAPATGLFTDRALPADRNSARLLPYHRLDVGARRAFGLWGSEAEFYLQIFNLYSRRNEWFVQYDTDEPETDPKVVKMLPIVPTFGLDFKF